MNIPPVPSDINDVTLKRFLNDLYNYLLPSIAGTITTKDEGTTLSTSVTTLNFTGSGVTASGAGATTTVNVPGSGTATITTKDETTVLSSTVDTLKFAGAGVTASGSGSETTVTIPGTASVPTGTGFRHVTAGAEDAASKLVDTADVNSNQITNAKLAQMATARIKGRVTAGTGDAEDLTGTQATTILDSMVGDSGAGGTKGLVPAPAAGDTAADKFLRAGGTWANPTVVSPATPYNYWMFGNGADGAFVFDGTNTYASYASKSGSVYTLIAPIYATNVTVDAGVTLKTNNFQLFVSGTLTNNGDINNNGNAGSGITGGGNIPAQSYAQARAGVNASSSGLSGSNASATTVALGGSGGGGGNGTGGAVGGNGGVSTVPTAVLGGLNYANMYWPGTCGATVLGGVLTVYGAGCGGGSGGGDAGTGRGGGGGGSGGLLGIWAKILAGNGTIRANGGAGGNAASVGGGGGGGGGGAIWFITTTTSPTSVNTFSVTGGAGGALAGGGQNGVNGSDGNTFINVVQ